MSYHRHADTHVHCSSIHNNLKSQFTYLSTDGWIIITVAHTHTMEFYSDEKCEICTKMDETSRLCTEWVNSGLERQYHIFPSYVDASSDSLYLSTIKV